MKICKAYILVVDSNGIHTNDFMDVIEYDGKFWLVPDWLDNSDRTMSRPTRIVSMEKLRHSRTPGANPEYPNSFSTAKSRQNKLARMLS